MIGKPGNTKKQTDGEAYQEKRTPHTAGAEKYAADRMGKIASSGKDIKRLSEPGHQQDKNRQKEQGKHKRIKDNTETVREITS
ncbi:hypothetical protein J5839_01700 [Methanosarcinaceae archaeon]|nr:hypothetical protein [Methanosarcinaceae archaeon]